MILYFQYDFSFVIWHLSNIVFDIKSDLTRIYHSFCLKTPAYTQEQLCELQTNMFLNIDNFLSSDFECAFIKFHHIFVIKPFIDYLTST